MWKLGFIICLFPILAFGQEANETGFQHCSGDQLYSTNPKDLRFYFVCIENRWIKEMCPENQYHLKLDGKCIEFPFPTELPTTEGCTPGSKIELTPYACYSECGGNEKFQMGKCCREHTYYNKNREKCLPVPPIYSESWNPELGCNDTLIAHPQFCGHYYKCSDDNWELMECEIGTVWNQSILKCSEDSSHCPTIENVTTSTGRIIIEID